jgi:hypothetical protein
LFIYTFPLFLGTWKLLQNGFVQKCRNTTNMAILIDYDRLAKCRSTLRFGFGSFHEFPHRTNSTPTSSSFWSNSVRSPAWDATMRA